jgi:transposase
MSKQSSPLIVDDATLSRLTELISKRTTPSGIARRAKIILSCIQGGTVRRIAQDAHTVLSTVIRWKNRFIKHGIAGIQDAARSGRPSSINKAFKAAVLSKLSEPPPSGYGQWDGALLAQVLNLSKHSVWKFLRQERISLARKRTWCISTDPSFVAKAADVVGLYLSPPENAMVICVDEKPNIQALKRCVGYAYSSDGKLIHGIESTYKRNGTVNLFAALNVATWFIHGKVTAQVEKTKKGFISFMDELLKELPSDGEYHVIMDNNCIHKRHEIWMAKHPDVYFHYKPTSASLLNMVEIWFGILRRKSLRGASFADTKQLFGHIAAFISAYNETATPFVWRKREVKGAQLKNCARNFEK